MLSPTSHAIVSCLDRNYLWGGYLLVASLRRVGVKIPIRLLTGGLSEEEQGFLTQFSDVCVTQPPGKAQPINQMQKPAAMMLAQDFDVITWMDADCVVSGDITARLALAPGGMMVRFRSMQENRLRFRSFTTPNGEIPPGVVEVWRRDMGEAQECRIATTCNSNVISIGRAHLPFIQRWERQIRTIVQRSEEEIRYAYRFSGGRGISDELILNSVLAFAHDVPSFSEYTLNKDPREALYHFGLQPKPWERWSRSTLQYRTLIRDILRWTEQAGYRMPPPRRHLQHYGPLAAKAQAYIGDLGGKARKAYSRLSARR